MKKLGNNIERLIAQLSSNSEEARINLRAHQVRSRYRKALETVYRDSAQMFLDHTNNVYIMKQDEVPTLIVYVDESIFAAELNAQRELIKLKLLELFGEEIDEFKIYVSRGSYKNNHPYREEEGRHTVPVEPLKPLGENDAAYVRQTSSVVGDSSVRRSLEKAMTADLARKRTKNETER